MSNSITDAIDAQIEVLIELDKQAPELGLLQRYRELVKDMDQIAAALIRAKQRGALVVLQALTAQAETFQQKLSELSAAFAAVQRATQDAPAKTERS